MAEPNPSPKPVTLLFHDGELADVRKLLGELGAGFLERRGVLLPEDQAHLFDLVIATPQRMLSLEFLQGQARPTQIAICDSDTRSLRNSLHRAGIQLMVRRPVHPAALRALLLHALYRGPEKRRRVRVSIGAPLRFRAGWRQRPAILADLSLGGCRLLTAHPLEPGRSLTLCIPPEIAGGGKPFSLKACVLRHLSEGSEGHTLTAEFPKLRPRQLELLKATIQAHASGPATFAGACAAPADVRRAPATRAAAGGLRAVSTPAPTAPSAPAASVASPGAARGPAPGSAPGNGDRRDAPRHQMDRRVIALAEQATRVLMGRDISIGGMRVNPNPLLQVGDDVRLAIHVGDQETPLVVTARVHRDDGERGVVLRFHELPSDTTRALNRMLDALPVVSPGTATPDSGMIVSEILAEAQ